MRGLLGRVDLAVAYPVDVVQHLSLEVGLVHHVHVDDADGAHPRGREVQRRRGAEPARAEQQDLGVEQLELALLAHLGHQQVALVAVALIGRQGAGPRPGPPLVLPLVEAAVHGHHVGVAHLLERHRREGGAHPARAHGHQRGGPVRDPVLDARLELASGDVHGAGDGALLVLVGLAHVEQGPALGQQLLAASGVDLTDLGLGLRQ